MNLVIEIGNSTAKFAVFKNDNLIKLIRFELDKINYSELSHYNFDKAILSGSGKIDNFDWSQIPSNKKIDFCPRLLSLIHTSYQPAEALGHDRWINAYFATKLFPQNPCLIIDMGTCITFTFIIENEIKGGSISPGFNLRLKSLHDYTAKLPLVKIESIETINLIGTSTVKSILSGVYQGISYEINGRIDEYLVKYPDLSIIMTGGDTLFFQNKINYKIFADIDFTLKGLNDILNYHNE